MTAVYAPPRWAYTSTEAGAAAADLCSVRVVVVSLLLMTALVAIKVLPSLLLVAQMSVLKLLLMRENLSGYLSPSLMTVKLAAVVHVLLAVVYANLAVVLVAKLRSLTAWSQCR